MECATGTAGGGSGGGSTGGTPSIEVGLANVDGTTSGKHWCEVSVGASSCQITVSWWGATNITSVALYPGGVGPHVPLKTGLSGSHSFTLRPESSDTTYMIQTTPSVSPTRDGTLFAKCATGSTWDGSKCATGTAGGGGSSTPTATLTIVPSGTVTYPTLVEYRLTSTNAKSCRVKDNSITYVAKSENVTSKTLSAITTPGTLTFETQCWSDLNGAGTPSAVTTRSITVVCPSGKSWNGSVCQ